MPAAQLPIIPAHQRYLADGKEPQGQHGHSGIGIGQQVLAAAFELPGRESVRISLLWSCCRPGPSRDHRQYHQLAFPWMPSCRSRYSAEKFSHLSQIHAGSYRPLNVCTKAAELRLPLGYLRSNLCCTVQALTTDCSGQVKNTFIDVEEESPDSIHSLHDRGARTCTARMSPSKGFFDEQPDQHDAWTVKRQVRVL